MEKLFILLMIIAITVVIVWLVRGRGIKTLGRISHQHQRAHQDEDLDDELTPKARQLEKLRHSKKFWGVEIQQGGCHASIALAGKQFEFVEAPALPLEECDARMCTCQYKGLTEHRSSHRRVQEDRRDSLRFDVNQSDRRALKDRRRKFDQWKGRA